MIDTNADESFQKNSPVHQLWPQK